uniref:Uncharacterized protein n=2 Tax=Canis lupus familiaris TaxID=9615 RepID=A0A8C0M8C7_CANLF
MRGTQRERERGRDTAEREAGSMQGAGYGKAFCLACYSVHGTQFPDVYRKELFDKTSKYLFLHSLAKIPLGWLLLASVPAFTYSLPDFTTRLNGDPRAQTLAPVGRSLLILGWLDLALGASLYLISRYFFDSWNRERIKREGQQNQTTVW